MRFFKRKEKGAFAIEAVIGITLFMLTIIAIMFMSVIIRVQANMQYALGQTAKEMSGYFYLIDKVGLAKYVSGKSVDLDAKAKEVNTNIGYIVDFASDAKETAANVVNANDINEIIDVINSSEDDLKNGVTNITNMVKTYKSGEQNPLEHIKLVLQIFGKSLANTAFGRYVGPIACDFLLPKYLTQGDEDDYFKQMGFIEKDGHYIDFTGSELLRDGRSINLVATYELDLSNLTFGMVHTTMKFRQVASTAAWVRPNGENLLAVEELFGQTTAPVITTTISVPKPTTTTEASSDPDETSVVMPPAVVTSSVFMPPAVVTSSVFMPPAVVTSSVFMPPAVVTSSVFMPPAVVTSSVFMPPAVIPTPITEEQIKLLSEIGIDPEDYNGKGKIRNLKITDAKSAQEVIDEYNRIHSLTKFDDNDFKELKIKVKEEEIEYRKKFKKGKAESGSKFSPAVAGVAYRNPDGKIEYFFGENNSDGEIPYNLKNNTDESYVLEKMQKNLSECDTNSYVNTRGAGSHAEVYAVVEMLKKYPNANPNDFVIYVTYTKPYNQDAKGHSFYTCEHCKKILEGLNVLSNVEGFNNADGKDE
ncbi:MAG: hypothetical protein KBA55_07550 [Ruminococcus sp.]|nr:hypothetical protein [Ruminococcus sp.]